MSYILLVDWFGDLQEFHFNGWLIPRCESMDSAMQKRAAFGVVVTVRGVAAGTIASLFQGKVKSDAVDRFLKLQEEPYFHL